MIKLNKLEEENKRYYLFNVGLFNDNKILKAKNNEILIQFKGFKEKESAYENSISNMKKENLEKIKILDEKLNYQLKQLELEYKQKIEKMSGHLKDQENKNNKVRIRN
jgi:hypothetical protein